MVFSLNAACGSFIGTGRSNNEDNFYFHKRHLPVENNGLRTPLQYDGETRDPLVFAVFDGMGGESKGEEAARISSEIFSSEYKELEELEEEIKSRRYSRLGKVVVRISGEE